MPPLSLLSIPDFTLPDLDGRSHSLSDFRGKIVIVNFWSAECPWSLRADQTLADSLEEWGQQVALLPVAPNANEPPEMLAKAASERGLPLVLLDSEREVAEAWGAQTTPHFFVFDPQGRLRYQGALDDVTFRQRTPSRHFLQDAVQALLKGDSPDPAETPPYGCTIVFYEA